MKNKTHIGYVAVILLLASFILVKFLQPSSKLTYINLSQVYEGFNLKKELSSKFEKGVATRDDILNDMYLSLENLAKELEKKPTEEGIKSYRKKEAVYYKKKQEFENQKTADLEKYDNQILKQLNQYVSDYGEQEGLDVILGANGQGNVMYGSKENDITSKVLEYVNDRYAGGTYE